MEVPAEAVTGSQLAMPAHIVEGLLAPDDPEKPRNPPGSAERQARRLLGLLG